MKCKKPVTYYKLSKYKILNVYLKNSQISIIFLTLVFPGNKRLIYIAFSAFVTGMQQMPSFFQKKIKAAEVHENYSGIMIA